MDISKDDLYCIKRLKSSDYGDMVIGFSTKCESCKKHNREECGIKLSLKNILITIKLKDKENKFYLFINTRYNNSIGNINGFKSREDYRLYNLPCSCGGRSHCHKCCYCRHHDESDYSEDEIEQLFNKDDTDDTDDRYGIDDTDDRYRILNIIEDNIHLFEEPDSINKLINYIRLFTISTDFFNSSENALNRFKCLIAGNKVKSARSAI
jgi:hypothetical protein